MASPADRFGPLSPAEALPEPQYALDPPRASATCSPALTEGGTEWYPPVMLGGTAIGADLVGNAARYIRVALTILDRLEPDTYSDYVRAFYRRGLERYGDRWGYADLITTLIALGDRVKPQSYLEIGVRRGRSVCALASVAPACDLTMFDMWVQNYAGMTNPGPELIESELSKIGHTGKRVFVSGDSHQTVRKYFSENPNAFFDIVNVDGDHSNTGAAEDIADVLSRLKIGGVIVFDDVSNHNVVGLRDVWRRMVVDDPRFSSFTYDDVGYGVGLAVRKF